MIRERVKIAGMGCNHCVNAVREALAELGVDIHQVEIGYAEVSYDPELDSKRIDAAITEAGYEPLQHETLA